MKLSVSVILIAILAVAVFPPAADGYFRLHVPEGCLGPEDPFCGGNNDPWRVPSQTGESICMDCYWNVNGTGFACGQVPLNFTGYDSCTTSYYNGEPLTCDPFGSFCENTVVTP